MQICHTVRQPVCPGAVFTKCISAVLRCGDDQISDALVAVHHIDEPAMRTRAKRIIDSLGMAPFLERGICGKPTDCKLSEILKGFRRWKLLEGEA
ncbi:hypothetical protein D3C73_1122230 [compost metagenome]